MIALFRNSTYWDSTKGMLWASAYTTDYYLGPGAYASGDRIQSPFMLGVLVEGLFRAYLDTHDPTIRARIIAAADYVDRYGLGPTGYIGDVFGWVDGAPWHKDAVPEYTTEQVNLLVLAYKLTGNLHYLERAKFFFNRGTKARYGHPNRTPDGVVDHFIDTQWDTSSGNIYLARNKGELFYTYLIFEKGGAPSLLK
jgi:hypothetical protein